MDNLRRESSYLCRFPSTHSLGDRLAHQRMAAMHCGIRDFARRAKVETEGRRKAELLCSADRKPERYCQQGLRTDKKG